MILFDQLAVSALNLRFGGGGEEAQLVVGLRQFVAEGGGFLWSFLLLLRLLRLGIFAESIGIFVCIGGRFLIFREMVLAIFCPIRILC